MKFLSLIIFQFGILTTSVADIYKCSPSNEPTVYTDRPCLLIPSTTLHINSTQTPPENRNDHFLTRQEKLLLEEINKREKRNADRQQREENRQINLKAKQITLDMNRLKAQKYKCFQYKDRLEKYENKVRSGYKASESNRLYENIRRYKKRVTTYCD